MHVPPAAPVGAMVNVTGDPAVDVSLAGVTDTSGEGATFVVVGPLVGSGATAYKQPETPSSTLPLNDAGGVTVRV